jgi:hypothetical protein
MSKTYKGTIEKHGHSTSFSFPGADLPNGTTHVTLLVNSPFEVEYRQLELILSEAHEQASVGKGKERHALSGQKFEDQLICEISRILKGHPFAFNAGQVIKKIIEAGRLNKEAAKREYLGAINYVAAMVILNEEENES